MNEVIVIETVLFICGFIYAMFNGNKEWNWMLRSLCGGLFFATSFILIPAIFIWEVLGKSGEKK